MLPCQKSPVFHHLYDSLPKNRRLFRESLSAFFAEARDLSGIQWPAEKTPPSLHELRSLSARLYSEQGINAQALLGHKSADMTAIYRDTRGAEWIEVEIA